MEGGTIYIRDSNDQVRQNPNMVWGKAYDISPLSEVSEELLATDASGEG